VKYIRYCIHIFAFAAWLPFLAHGQTFGKDGAKTVSATETVNIYTRLTNSVAAGATQLRVTSSTGFAAGDLILIYQAQGATINTTSDDVTYGTVTAYNNAGNYELRAVASIASSTRINLTTGLQRSYTSTGNAQVIRVPLYSSLTVASGGTIAGSTWDGQIGGIVAVHVNGTAVIDGKILADGLGFRGGALSTNGGTTGDFTTYRTATVADAAEKGESIAGLASTLANGQYGRGAPANGGGGGNNHNGGGGGGSNGNDGNGWTGQGVMGSGCVGCSAAWMLDTAYIANGGYTTSSGGGRGGYTYSAIDADALTQGPGNTAWGGANRRQRGGLGGHPLTIDPCTRVFFGGGGGAGHQNNAVGGAGGRGGGIVFLIANAVTGAGSVTANGSNGGNTTGAGNDAPGGGGGGGTIIIDAPSISGITVNANGGSGGIQSITTAEAEGPGGGGGGGFIGTHSTVVTRTVDGGGNGTTNSPSLTEFPSNGSTGGATGEISTSLCDLPLPVQLVSFSARRMNTDIILRWKTATEIDNYGFEIQRRCGDGEWCVIGFVPGSGSTSAPQSYSFSDRSSPGNGLRGILEYRLRQIDRNGNSAFSGTAAIDGQEYASAPTLSMAPHPVTTAANLEFSLDRKETVTLTVYNLLGDEVRRLVRNEVYDAGPHVIPFHRESISSGIYFFRLTAGTQTVTRRFTLL
jgi:hypothetical protein